MAKQGNKGTQNKIWKKREVVIKFLYYERCIYL